MAIAAAFVTALVVGVIAVPFFRRIKAGQRIREDGPSWHMSKTGTPTMGGIIFICGTIAACLTAGYSLMLEGEYGHIFVLALSVAFGAVGFLDDYEKLRKKQNLGLTAGKKFLLQVAVAALFVLLMRDNGYLTPSLYIPFVNIVIEMNEWLYLAFAIFAIVSTVNAVNITDGVDGLAAGTSLPVFLFYVTVVFMWGEEFLSLGIFSAGMLGGLLAFLIFNYNPAKIFMGDTGSLFLGGAVAGMAFALNMPLIIVIIGFLYVLEVLSDIIQVAYFKLTGGKRFFKMAPFHHHLEMGGWSGRKWSEKRLFALFTTISLILAIAALIGVSGRYSF
jgi:phospho-N-acetylmuramoyl-pentapeptide-transferase